MAKSPKKNQKSKAAPKKKVAAKKSAPKKQAAKKPAAKKQVKSAPKKTTPKKENVISMSQARESKTAKQNSKTFSANFTPLDDRVLVQRMGVSDRTPGGIIIPDSVASSEKPNQGRVVAVGQGHRNKKGRLRPLDVQKGDTVMFAKFSGAEVNIAGEDLLLLREEEIIAVVKT